VGLVREGKAFPEHGVRRGVLFEVHRIWVVHRFWFEAEIGHAIFSAWVPTECVLTMMQNGSAFVVGKGEATTEARLETPPWGRS
jgi:hypothetical protein